MKTKPPAIEHGIPIPPKARLARSPLWNVLPHLKPGESCLHRCEQTDRNCSHITAIVSVIRRTAPAKKFVTRSAEGGFRVWRKE